jgi:DNA-binding transcriptional regulator LsrR (DeoR family)
MTGRVTLALLAAQLGISEQQAQAELDRAVSLGFLSIVADDGVTVTYEARLPGDLLEAS